MKGPDSCMLGSSCGCLLTPRKPSTSSRSRRRITRCRGEGGNFFVEHGISRALPMDLDRSPPFRNAHPQNRSVDADR